MRKENGNEKSHDIFPRVQNPMLKEPKNRNIEQKHGFDRQSSEYANEGIYSC